MTLKLRIKQRCFSFFLLATLLSAAVNGRTLVPFHIDLEGYQYAAVPVKVTGTQTLVQRGEGLWRLALELRGPLTRIEEWVDFRWVDGEPVPLEYRYNQRVPFNNESRRLRFEPEQQRIRVNLNDDAYTYPYDANVFDPLSYTLLLLNGLARGETEFQFSVIDRRNPRHYEFSIATDTSVNEPHAVVIAQRVPARGITYIVLDTQWQIPTHFLRWRNDKLDQQIRALEARVGDRNVSDLPHWSDPRSNLPS
ncbi:DUF3108 domain-containing protein [Salinispirillum marinum]|uniref:DUF3108 domain-containing protein n=2 Tax=Saccharospirillaceae TaxID=255527 RepID=A0ABV8BHY6_9GAMM